MSSWLCIIINEGQVETKEEEKLEVDVWFKKNQKVYVEADTKVEENWNKFCFFCKSHNLQLEPYRIPKSIFQNKNKMIINQAGYNEIMRDWRENPQAQAVVLQEVETTTPKTKVEE